MSDTQALTRKTIPATMARATFELTRRGEFKVETFGPNHCGTQDGIFHWRLRVTCGAESLDSRGFLFDQAAVRDHLNEVIKTDRSCEFLARSIGSAMLRRISKENPRLEIESFSFTISPESGCEITYRVALQ